MSKTDFPSYFTLLPAEDQVSYERLKGEISTSFAQQKNTRISDNFGVVIQMLKEYIYRTDREDERATRSLVCGIVWEGDTIAINTRQLRFIIGKCKSSINNGFQAIGYNSIQTTPEIASLLTKLYPFLRNNFSEMRQWTVRQLKHSTNKFIKPEAKAYIPLVPEISAFEHHFEEEELSSPGCTFEDVFVSGFAPIELQNDFIHDEPASWLDLDEFSLFI